MFAAEEPFEVEGVKFNAGSFLIPSSGNPEDLLSQLKSATASLGLRAHAIGSEIKVKRHPVSRAEDRLAPHLGQHAERRLVPPGPRRMRGALLIHLRPGCPRHARPEGEVRRDHLSARHVESPDLDQRRPQAAARRRLGLRRPGPVQVHRADAEPGGRRRLGRYPRRPGFRRAGPPEDVRGAGRRLRPDHRERRPARGARHDRARHDRRAAPASGQWVRPPRERAGQTEPDRLRLRRHGRALLQPGPGLPRLADGGGGFGRGGAGGPGGESAARPTGRGSATDADIPQGRPLREFEREPTLEPGRARAPYRARDCASSSPARSCPRGCGRAWSSAGRTKKTSGSAACSRAAPSSRGRPRSSTCRSGRATSSSSATTRCGGTRPTAASCSCSTRPSITTTCSPAGTSPHPTSVSSGNTPSSSSWRRRRSAAHRSRPTARAFSSRPTPRASPTPTPSPSRAVRSRR